MCEEGLTVIVALKMCDPSQRGLGASPGLLVLRVAKVPLLREERCRCGALEKLLGLSGLGHTFSAPQ